MGMILVWYFLAFYQPLLYKNYVYRCLRLGRPPDQLGEHGRPLLLANRRDGEARSAACAEASLVDGVGEQVEEEGGGRLPGPHRPKGGDARRGLRHR